MNIKLKKPIFLVILLSFIYTAAMGVGWVLNPNQYGELENVVFMIPVLILLSFYSIFLTKKYGVGVAQGKIKFTPVFWLFNIIIGYLILTNILIYADGRELGPLINIAKLFAATLLVGVAEEFFFRGYVLNSIERTRYANKALLYSSILFGLMHSVNFLAGPSIIATSAQVLITTMAGYIFGSIYLRTGRNLLLVAILHALYDFLVFGSSYLANINNSMRTTFLVIPFLLVIWVYAYMQNKSSKDN